MTTGCEPPDLPGRCHQAEKGTGMGGGDRVPKSSTIRERRTVGEEAWQAPGHVRDDDRYSKGSGDAIPRRLKSRTLLFDSRFEGGNLSRVWQVGDAGVYIERARERWGKGAGEGGCSGLQLEERRVHACICVCVYVHVLLFALSRFLSVRGKKHLLKRVCRCRQSMI